MPRRGSRRTATGPLKPDIDLFEQYGRPGLLALGGRLFDEWDVNLQGLRGRKVYREMADQDPMVGAILFAFEMLVRQTHWYIDPTDDTPEAVLQAEFIDSARLDMEEGWAEVLAELLSLLVYGWSYLEVNYKVRAGRSTDPTRNSKVADGKIGWRSWAIRAQESLDRWEFADDGTLLGMWQIPPPDYRLRYVPYDKALLFRLSTRRASPEGRSLLRNAYRPWSFKDKIEKVEAIGIERDLAGFPTLYVPPNIASPENMEDQQASDAYFQALTNIRVDEQAGIMLPSVFEEKSGKRVYELTLLSTGGARSFNTTEIIDRYSTAIAQSVLADFLMLGHTTAGTQALGKSKIELFTTALAALLDSIIGVINDRAVPWLCRLNNMNMDLVPQLKHGAVEKTNLQELSLYLLNLAKSGAQLNLGRGSPLLNYILEEADLPTDEPLEDQNPQRGGGPGHVRVPGQVAPGAARRQPPVAGPPPVSGQKTPPGQDLVTPPPIDRTSGGSGPQAVGQGGVSVPQAGYPPLPPILSPGAAPTPAQQQRRARRTKPPRRPRARAASEWSANGHTPAPEPEREG